MWEHFFLLDKKIHKNYFSVTIIKKKFPSFAVNDCVIYKTTLLGKTQVIKKKLIETNVGQNQIQITRFNNFLPPLKHIKNFHCILFTQITSSHAVLDIWKTNEAKEYINWEILCNDVILRLTGWLNSIESNPRVRFG